MHAGDEDDALDQGDPVAGLGQQAVQQRYHRAADDRAPEGARAADQARQHHQARHVPADIGQGCELEDQYLQAAGQPRQGRGERHHDDQVLLHLVAQGQRALLAVVEGPQHHAERRMDDPVDQGERRQHDHQHHEIQHDGPVEVQNAQQGAARHPLQAVLAARRRPSHGDEVDHFRQGQGHHRKVDSAPPERECGEGSTQRRGNRDGPKQCDFDGVAEILHEEGRRVGGHPIEGGMPERQQPAVAEYQVERGREQRHGERFHQENRIDHERREQQRRSGHGEHQVLGIAIHFRPSRTGRPGGPAALLP